MLLAGDIGGTKTLLAVFSADSGPRQPLAQATFPSGDFPSLEAVVEEFRHRVSLPIDRACFGVAGPVVNRTAKVTNLPWTLDERAMATELGLTRVHLLNDLESIAYGVPLLTPLDLHTLNEGTIVEHGAIGVVAPGTGLGEAYLTYDTHRYTAHPSEGGHVDFAPTNELQVGLLTYLWRNREHVSYERVVSGQGIPNIYAYLRDSGAAEEPEWLRARLAHAHDVTPAIVDAALDRAHPVDLCIRTLQLFVAALAAEAGNMALKVLATGGVYLGGGIPPRILSLLDPDTFMRAFSEKGRFDQLLRSIPVHVILHPEIALLGAASYGLDAQTRGS